jgi:hypothetical protein
MVPGHHLGVTGAAGRLEILRRAWRNHSLRRLCLATAGFRLAELAVWIAITAYAYRAGGVDAAALVMVAQLAPATVFALTVGGLVNRFGASAVLRDRQRRLHRRPFGRRAGEARSRRRLR